MFLVRNTIAMAAALAISAVAAQAADMAVKAPPAPPPFIPQATGYVEVYGGGARTTESETFCLVGDGCDFFSARFNGIVLGGAGRATYWFTPTVSTQIDAQAEGTSYSIPSQFLGPFSSAHFSTHNYLIGGHINLRSQQQGLIGLFAGAGDAGGSGIFSSLSSQRHVVVGAEGQYYFNNFTAYLQGGYDTTVSNVGFGFTDVNAWFIRGTGRYFVTPNFMLEGTGLYSDGKANFDTSFLFPVGFPTSLGFQTWLWQAKAEYRFDASPFSLFAKYQGSETKYNQFAFDGETSDLKVTDHRFLVGLRVYMGEGSLLSNDRKGSTLDIIDPLGAPTGILMFGGAGSSMVATDIN